MTVDLDRVEKWGRRAEETGEFPAVTYQEVLAMIRELRAAREVVRRVKAHREVMSDDHTYAYWWTGQALDAYDAEVSNG